VKLIRTATPAAQAAEAAGISESTYYSWLKRGNPAGKKQADAPYREFREQVLQAQAEAEAILVTRIGNAAAKGSWQAAAFLLERQYPERWAKPNGKEPSDGKAHDPFADLDGRDDELSERRRGKKATGS
jgi:hypothetical protein